MGGLNNICFLQFWRLEAYDLGCLQVYCLVREYFHWFSGNHLVISSYGGEKEEKKIKLLHVSL
jgi:hypothetical protein